MGQQGGGEVGGEAEHRQGGQERLEHGPADRDRKELVAGGAQMQHGAGVELGEGVFGGVVGLADEVGGGVGGQLQADLGVDAVAGLDV